MDLLLGVLVVVVSVFMVVMIVNLAMVSRVVKFVVMRRMVGLLRLSLRVTPFLVAFIMFCIMFR